MLCHGLHACLQLLHPAPATLLQLPSSKVITSTCGQFVLTPRVPSGSCSPQHPPGSGEGFGQPKRVFVVEMGKRIRCSGVVVTLVAQDAVTASVQTIKGWICVHLVRRMESNFPRSSVKVNYQPKPTGKTGEALQAEALPAWCPQWPGPPLCAPHNCQTPESLS